MATSGKLRVGIGGWDYAPWRETFYPKGVPQKKALEYASRQVNSIEINGTFYRTAKPGTRKHKIATVITDAPNYPNVAEVTGEFVYARRPPPCTCSPCCKLDATACSW